MTRGSPRKTGRSVDLAVLFTCFVLSAAVPAMAGKEAVQLEGVGYNVNASLQDNLKSLVGKQVSCSLDSGHAVVGRIKEVGEHLVHLEKLEGKEFFDALVRIETILAVNTRFRVYK